MVVVAQLVRASVCGTEGRGFEPHLPPKRMKPDEECHPAFFVFPTSWECGNGNVVMGMWKYGNVGGNVGLSIIKLRAIVLSI